jgi:crotonobetainyl-CoA:carnitine CoA-transferase CaiB-like acyl-CoA transferase
MEVQEAELLTTQMEALISTRTVAEWCAELDRVGVPCGPVRLPAEVFEDAHVVENDLIRVFEHPIVGSIKMPNSPVRMSAAETGSRAASPALGQHTREFLAQLGYSSAEVASLEQSGVVHSWKPA